MTPRAQNARNPCSARLRPPTLSSLLSRCTYDDDCAAVWAIVLSGLSVVRSVKLRQKARSLHSSASSSSSRRKNSDGDRDDLTDRPSRRSWATQRLMLRAIIPAGIHALGPAAAAAAATPRSINRCRTVVDCLFSYPSLSYSM